MQYKNPRYDRLNHQSSLRFLKTRTRKWKRAICNWVSKMIRDCITFAFLRSVIGSENSCHPFDQSDAKLTPMVVCVACDFPRFRKFGRFYCEFPLALKGIFLSSERPLLFLWFWFHNTRSKSALLSKSLMYNVGARHSHKVGRDMIVGGNCTYSWNLISQHGIIRTANKNKERNQKDHMRIQSKNKQTP